MTSMTSTTMSGRRPSGAARVVLAVITVAGPVLLATTAWALRPVASPGTEPDRLRPAVVEPRGPSRQDDPAQPAVAPPTAPRSGAGASGPVWDTSRGYPVAVDPPRRPAGTSAPYAWLLPGDSSGSQPRWNPCAPVHVQVNPSGLTAAARPVVRWAFAELEERTGLYVRLGEDTRETVTGPLSTRDWTRGTWTTATRRSWAPVLVFTSDAHRTPELAGGVSGWTAVHTDAGAEHLVSGTVALDSADVGDADGEAGRRRLRMLLLHELGHLAGLAHVEDPDLVMHGYVVPRRDEQPSYGYGDRLGLAAAGRGPC